jgi:hypothetical protein
MRFLEEFLAMILWLKDAHFHELSDLIVEPRRGSKGCPTQNHGEAQNAQRRRSARMLISPVRQ